MGGSQSKPSREIRLLPEITSWTKEVEKRLRHTCLEYPMGAGSHDSNKMKILMVGASGNGKSALINSLLSAMTGQINLYTLASNADGLVTKSLYSPHVRVKGKPLNFKLTDMPGLSQSSEHTEAYLTAVLGGHIKEDVVVPLETPPMCSDHYIENPKPFDLPCCVVLVMKAGKLACEATQHVCQLVTHRAADFAQLAVLSLSVSVGRRPPFYSDGLPAPSGWSQPDRIPGLKVAVVLTFVDNLLDMQSQRPIGKNVTRIFHEEAVHRAVLQASNDTGIPISFIHPLVNYTHEVKTIKEMNILHLHTLSKILDLAWEGAKSR